MRTYSEEFKAQIMAQMLPPTHRGIPELARETGIPKDTLYTWRGKQRMAVATTGAQGPAVEGFTSADQFHRVVESAALNAQEVGEFCRRRGLYPEQLAAWREACLVANTPPPRREEPAECRALRRRNSELESELRRKEKALAEAATLLVLQKKVRVLLGEPGDGNWTSGSDRP
jgi:transposase